MVVLVTGSSTGFGRKIVEVALERGHRVAATARKPEALDGLVGQDLLRLPLDVTDDESVRSAFESAVERFGRLDAVVNNAGFGFGGAIEEFSDEEIRRQYDTNVFGAIRVIRHALPTLRAQGSGHILNVTSVGGFRSRPGFGLYASTKFALEAIGEALYHELAPLGIHVTNVEPGSFRTDFAGRSFVRAGRTIEAYDATAHENLRWIDSIDGGQPGDPVKAARAILDLVGMENPPLRLALGKDALEGIRSKLAHVGAELDRMEDVTVSTDFDES